MQANTKNIMNINSIQGNTSVRDHS